MYLYWDEDNSPNSFNDVTVQTIFGVSAGTRQIKGQKRPKKQEKKVWDDKKGGKSLLKSLWICRIPSSLETKSQ